MRSEKDVKITRPVKIDHPTDLVLLPFLKRTEEPERGELWQLKAIGGTGYYQWSIENSNIATISGAG